jgi:hypothetical protein
LSILLGAVQEDWLKEYKKPGCLEIWNQIKVLYPKIFRDALTELENKVQL